MNKKIIAALIAGVLSSSPVIADNNKDSSIIDENQNPIEVFDIALYKHFNDLLYDYKKDMEHKAQDQQLKSEAIVPIYDIDEVTLHKIAYICQQKHSTIEGVAAEAMYMANKYELYGVDYASIVDFILSDESYAKYISDDNIFAVLQENYEIVKNVLVLGYRPIVFPQYMLDEYQTKRIARLCQQEQGTVYGAAAEATLMANRFELYGEVQGFNTLERYVENSGWFYNASSFMNDTDSLKPEIYEVVDKVLNKGYRPIPGYIDNHDCRSDIISGDDSTVRNIYGATYNYYYVPGCTDIFGYSDYAMSVRDDEHYQMQDVQKYIYK